jgi:hypothetical protein
MSGVVPLKNLQPRLIGYCVICQEDKKGEEMYCKRDTWVRCCADCAAKCHHVCPHCRDAGCRMPAVSPALTKQDLQRLFGDARVNLANMNDSMFVEFSETEVKVGITRAPEGNFRSAGGPQHARAAAWVEDGKGTVSLSEGDKFTGWVARTMHVDGLLEDADMLRTMVHVDADTKQRRQTTQDLGPAKAWAKALLWANGKPYPVLEGHTAGGYGPAAAPPT